jgi:hypothetical protein
MILKNIFSVSTAIVSILLIGSISNAQAPSTTQAVDHTKMHGTMDHGAMMKDGKMDHGAMMKEGMKNHMEMGQMSGMMHQCMEAHKDGKMCDQQMMEKCQEKMAQGECKKMMETMKSQDKGKK